MAEIDDKLLAEILADPDDDRPRLVLADVLTHRGDARGEFIALQCRIASQPADPAVAEWTARSDQLLAENQADPRPDKRWLAVPASRVTWRRGFPELVHARQEDILDAPSIPGLLTLELGNCQNARTLRMAGAGILRHIRKLHLSTAVSTDPLASGGLAALAEVPFRLVELGMVSRVGPAGIEAFAKNPSLRALEVVDFNNLHPGPAARGLRALFAVLVNVRILRLTSCNITDAAAVGLAGLPPSVTRLNLGWNRNLGEGVLRLQSETLQVLDISGTAVSAAVASVLIEKLPGLKVLIARHTPAAQVDHPRVQAAEVKLVTA